MTLRSVCAPPGLQHSLPRPGQVTQLCGLRGQRGEDPQRRQRVCQLPHPSVSRLPQEAHDWLETAVTATLPPGAPPFCLLKKQHVVQCEVWNIREAETAASQHIRVICKPFNVRHLFVCTVHSHWIFLQCTHSFLSLLWLQSVTSQLS